MVAHALAVLLLPLAAALAVRRAGAPYQLPSLFSEHAQGPVYKQEFESPKHMQDNGMPHPSKVRTAATEPAIDRASAGTQCGGCAVLPLRCGLS